jgi:hypothetical protein
MEIFVNFSQTCFQTCLKILISIQPYFKTFHIHENSYCKTVKIIISIQESYSQDFIFFVTYEIAHKPRVFCLPA